jgi:hypothetical protein
MGLGPEKKINWDNVNNLLVKGDLTSEILHKMMDRRFSPNGFDGENYGPPSCSHFDDNNDGYCDCCDYEME